MLPSTYPDLDLQYGPGSMAPRRAIGCGCWPKCRNRLRHIADLNELFHDLAQRLPRIVPFDYINLVLHDPARNVMRLHLLAAPVDSTIKAGAEFPVDELARRLRLEDTAAA